MENLPQQKNSSGIVRIVIGVALILLSIFVANTDPSPASLFSGLIGWVLLGAGIIFVLSGIIAARKPSANTEHHLTLWIGLIALALFLSYFVWLLSGMMRYK